MRKAHLIFVFDHGFDPEKQDILVAADRGAFTAFEFDGGQIAEAVGRGYEIDLSVPDIRNGTACGAVISNLEVPEEEVQRPWLR